MSGLRFLTQARENGVGGEIAAQNVKNEVVATNAIKILFATRTRIQLVIREQRYATDRVVDDDTNFTYRVRAILLSRRKFLRLYFTVRLIRSNRGERTHTSGE